MDIINLRRSVRSFSDREIENDKIDLILRAAMQSPSAVNQRPWEFIVIKNKEMINDLAINLKKGNALASAKVVILLVTNKTDLKVESMYPQDMSNATYSILLKATELGIGSCWLGVFPREERVNIVKEKFNLVDGIEPFSMVSLGYPSNEDAFRFIDRYDETKIHYEEY